jgi:hypothetical protein
MMFCSGLSGITSRYASHHNQKTTQQDPVTKAQRKAGKYREQEERAASSQ